MVISVDQYPQVSVDEGSISFLEAVEVNEQIKKVIEISEHISMSALNCIFIARASSHGAQGFHLVSVELRKFSAKLRQHMEDLKLIIFKLIQHVSYRQKQMRQCRHLSVTQGIGENEMFLRPAIARVNQTLVANAEQIHVIMRQLSTKIVMAKKACNIGSMVSCIGKIEAVHDNEYSKQLTQVAEAIERDIELISNTLKMVYFRLTGKNI